MTFLCNYRDHAHFYQTPHADFQAAVQPFTERAGKNIAVSNAEAHFVRINTVKIIKCSSLSLSSAGIPFRSFYQHHTNIHDTIKGRLTPQYMTEMCPLLSQRFHHELRKRGERGTMELMEFVRCVMFPAVVQQLFGPENLKLSQVAYA